MTENLEVYLHSLKPKQAQKRSEICQTIYHWIKNDLV